MKSNTVIVDAEVEIDIIDYIDECNPKDVLDQLDRAVIAEYMTEETEPAGVDFVVMMHFRGTIDAEAYAKAILRGIGK